MSSFETIAVDIDGGILTLTLNRPERLNAFNRAMMEEMIAALDIADADDAVRAVIVTGAGRAFCAGADLGAGGATFDYGEGARWSDAGSPVRSDGSVDYDHEGVRDGGGLVSLRIFNCRKPVIGAINGAAVGIGVTMTLPMDIRPQALKWCYSGRIFDAAEALSGGLVSAIHPGDALLPAARALALELTAESAPVSIALTRQMLWRMAGAAHPIEAHRLDSRLVWARGASADAKEGIGSFLEKRAAHFPDRVSTGMPHFARWMDDPDYR